MDFIEPTTEEWRALYHAADAVKASAPWTFMEETDLFGVQNPETGEIGYVSVMGQAGEQYGIALYLGDEGGQKFWLLQELGPHMRAEDLFLTPQLQAFFEDRRYLSPEDLATIKALGLKYRGRNAWPQFRSMRPGYDPWFIDAAEARFLTLALEQLVALAPRIEADPDILVFEDGDDYLVRALREGPEGVDWQDTQQRMGPLPPHDVRINIDADTMNALSALKPTEVLLQADLFLAPVRIEEDTGRPFTTYILLLVDGTSGFVYGQELLRTKPSLQAMQEQVPPTFCRLLVKAGVRPTDIWSSSQMLLTLIAPPLRDLGINLAYQQVLPALDEAKEALIGYLSRGPR